MAMAVDCFAVEGCQDCLVVACSVTDISIADTSCMAMAANCIAVEGLAVEGIAGTDFVAVTGWMEIAFDYMHVPVEGNAGTDCPTVAC